MTKREKAMNGLKCCACPSGACGICPYFKDRSEPCVTIMAADALELLKQHGWISVNDRLPRIDEDVLILYESKASRKTGYAITCLKDSFYFGSTPIPYQTPQWSEPWQYFRENNIITHWMPLPEPPKEEN